MKKSEFLEKTSDELSVERDKMIQELKELKIKRVTGVIENPLKLRTIKRSIARINTVIHMRELDRLKKEIME